MGRLDDRVAIVTGGFGYLGGGVTAHLAQEGASVVVADILDASKAVDAIKAGGRDAIWVETNVADKGAVERMVATALDRFGKIDILVNMAAIVVGMQTPWMEITTQEWQRHMDVDLMGMLLCTQAVYPAMKAGGYGRIVNISSGRLMRPGLNELHYTSAKGGVTGFTRAMASELGDDGICVNAVMPGFYPHERLRSGTQASEMLEEQKARQTIKRIGTAEDLAPAVGFLASEGARYITGQTLCVCGGEFRVGG